MLLADKLNEFNTRLLESPVLMNCSIIKAYPFAMKPSRLEKKIIATSVGNIEGQCVSIGGNEQYGKYKINAFIYAPYKNADLNDTVAEVIKAQLCAFPAEIYVSEISKNDDLECLFVKCSLTFYDKLNMEVADE